MNFLAELHDKIGLYKGEIEPLQEVAKTMLNEYSLFDYS